LILKKQSLFAGVYCTTEHPRNPRSLRAKTEPKMSKLHLTDITVLRLHAPGTYLDDTLPGFGVRVGKNRKSWIVMRGQIRQRQGNMVVRILYSHGRLVEEPKRARDLIDSLRPQPAANQTQLIPAYIFKRQPVRRLAEMLAEVFNGADVSGLS
jgi:hypothetical protein